MTPFSRGGVVIALVKVVIALIMKAMWGAPHPCMGTWSQCLQEGLLQAHNAPTNEAPLPELSSEQPTELHANLSHNQSLESLGKANQRSSWNLKVQITHPSSPDPAVSCLFTLYYSTIWFLICSHCLLKTWCKAHHNQIYSSWSLFSFRLNYNFANLKDWMDLFEKEVGRDWTNWFLSVCKWRVYWKCIWRENPKLRKDKGIDFYSLEGIYRMTWRKRWPLSYVVSNF